MRARRWRLAAGALVLLAALALLYTPVRVTGESMLPVLEDGDLLLTRPLWLGEPDRFDLVVFEDPDGQASIKRVAGLPGESVQLLDSELVVNGRKLQREVHGAEELLPLADGSGHGADRVFRLREAGFRAEQDAWRLDGTGLALVRAPGSLEEGLWESGRWGDDLGLEVTYSLLDRTAVLELRLWEGLASFRLRLGEGGRRAELAVLEEGRTRPLTVHFVDPPAASGRLFLANVDQRLTVALDGRLLGPPVPYPLVPEKRFADRPEIRFQQVAVGGRGPLRVRRIRLGVDLSWSATGTWAMREPLQLSGDEYFLLGDHASDSVDSRRYGPVSRKRLRGVVVGRLLPPGPVGWGW